MAEAVIGIGVPHGPMYPQLVAEQGPESALGRRYGAVRERLEAAAPDLVVVLTADHFVNFFFDNLPTFAVGILDHAHGPHERHMRIPRYDVEMDEAAGAAFHSFGIDQGFDLAACHELRIDHALMVPLHFLTPRMDVPVLPVYIRGLQPPLPRAERVLAFGGMLRRFIDERLAGRRVAVVASGSFSLEVGGPRIPWLDPEWCGVVNGAMQTGALASVAPQASTERMLQAGNVGGELLNWIALFGMLGDRPPDHLEPDGGHSFAVWEPR